MYCQDIDDISETMEVGTNITLGNIEYEIISRIPAGSVGCVYKAKNENTLYALKEFPKGAYDTKIGTKTFTITPEQNLDLALTADQIMTFLNDENSVYFAKYHGWFETTTSYFLVSEWIDGVPIDIFTANLKDKTLIVPIIRQLFQFIFWLHKNDIIHCDLHPKNILVINFPTQIKIIDFGLSYDVDCPNSTSCNNLRFNRSIKELKFRDLNRLKVIAINLIYSPCNQPVVHDRQMMVLDLALCSIKSEFSYHEIRDDICEVLRI